jgi:hypothetical protein
MRLMDELLGIGYKSYFYDNYRLAYEITKRSRDLLIINVEEIGDEASVFVSDF